MTKKKNDIVVLLHCLFFELWLRAMLLLLFLSSMRDTFSFTPMHSAAHSTRCCLSDKIADY